MSNITGAKCQKKARFGARYKSWEGYESQDELRKPEESGRKNKGSKSANVRRSTRERGNYKQIRNEIIA